jgi:HNH endonuclease
VKLNDLPLFTFAFRLKGLRSKKCHHCGAEYQQNCTAQKFCSRKCRVLANSSSVECDWCHKAFLKTHKQTHCSAKCAREDLQSRSIGKVSKCGRGGYLSIRMPKHISANKRGLVSQHRYVMECYLGRPLGKDEHVHHVNGNPTDNRLENLRVMPAREHRLLTRREVRAALLEYRKAGMSLAPPA